ncbi:MAG TPA: TRAM domain-containing protein, partial [Solirubrobacteraceae bacterium]|nr:TRAM domain-containing protein [Solirubrobacteraceae bacterium]
MSAPTQPTAERPRKGAELDLRVDGLAFGGAGVARHDGYVVFVRGAVPGDRVRAVLTARRRAYGEARLLEVLEPGPDRIEPVADHPGAPWQVLPYARQAEVKRAQVDDALRRIGRLDGFELEPLVEAVEPWRYRNKLEYSFGAEPAEAGGRGELVCGFHAPGSWERIVPLTDCLLASERGNAVREAVVGWCRERGLRAWDRRTQEGLLRNLVVREGRRTGQVQVRLVTSDAPLDTTGLAEAAGADSVVWTRVPGVAETTGGGVDEVVHGIEAIDEELSGLRFRI